MGLAVRAGHQMGAKETDPVLRVFRGRVAREGGPPPESQDLSPMEEHQSRRGREAEKVLSQVSVLSFQGPPSEGFPWVAALPHKKALRELGAVEVTVHHIFAREETLRGRPFLPHTLQGVFLRASAEGTGTQAQGCATGSKGQELYGIPQPPATSRVYAR